MATSPLNPQTAQVIMGVSSQPDLQAVTQDVRGHTPSVRKRSAASVSPKCISSPNTKPHTDICTAQVIKEVSSQPDLQAVTQDVRGHTPSVQKLLAARYGAPKSVAQEHCRSSANP
jgi:hypothetical protein